MLATLTQCVISRASGKVATKEGRIAATYSGCMVRALGRLSLYECFKDFARAGTYFAEIAQFNLLHR